MHKVFRRVIFSVLSLSPFALFANSDEWREPLPEAEPGTWQWVDIPGTMCRDGSGAGISVNYSGDSSDVVIYLEGGGACFNNSTCRLNPKAANKKPPKAEGIFNRLRAENPFKNYNFVYVPYCTGDVFAGNRENVRVSRSIDNQQFVGYRNMTRFLQHIAPTFVGASKVVLTGVSAGGFGSILNYDQTKRIMGDTDVYMIDDSGIPFSDQYMSSCLQSKWRDLWNMQFPEDCENCRNNEGGGFINYVTYLENKYPERDFAFISSLSDSTIRFFYGFGRNNCRVLIPSMRSRDFRAGMLEIRDEIAYNQGRFFLFEGTAHTYLKKSKFYDVKRDGQAMNEFVSDYLEGNARNRGPAE